MYNRISRELIETDGLLCGGFDDHNNNNGNVAACLYSRRKYDVITS